MAGCKPAATPMNQKEKFCKEDGAEKVDEKLYRSLIGCLMYLSASRPDILHAVSLLSRYMNCASRIHFQAAKRVLRYVKDTIDFGIRYHYVKSFRLHGYSDSDWAGCADDMRSTSVEVEYVAATAVVNQALWIRKLMTDLHMEQQDNTQIFVDNQAAISISNNPMFHGKTKHFKIKLYFLREAHKEGEVKLIYSTTEEQSVDILTKAFPKARYEFLRQRLGIGEVYNAMRLSYDDLDHKEQKILLDLVCFFMGLNMKVDHIKVLLKDSEKDDSVAVGLERLKDKALITISEDNVISMHDIIQEKASEIVRLESIVDPGNRSQLMHPDDTYEVLKYNKGTEAIRSIRADLSVIRKLQEFFCGKPGILDLSHNQVEKLWDGVQNLVNLKEVKVSGSENLKELPDLSEATNLEVLDINFCPRLTSVTPSIFSLNRLERLSVAYCSLTKITSKNHLSSLRYLNLESCKKLREFSVASENMIELDLSSTCVNAFTSSFGCQSKLKILQLRESGIESLPSSFKKLTRLQYLNVYKSKELCTLTELPTSLEILTPQIAQH
ncbi:Copia protein [Glycine soja]|uniref:Copia protein n=1 Tax=Glycine soja TaxID=3848 RepID=A0A445L774_GLYSO|nr:Copia protein [Glycine soja]